MKQASVNKAAKAGGYTMLELLTVLGIVAVLAVMVTPGFQDSIQRNARESAMLEVVSAISLARSEAVTRGRLVTICRSTDQAACAASTGADWDDGWIIFVDGSTAGTLDGTDELVEVQGPGNDAAAITLLTRLNGTFTGDFLRFDADGFLANSTTGAWFKFCESDNVVANARAVLLGNTGRPALSVAGANGVHDDLAGDDLTCP